MVKKLPVIKKNVPKEPNLTLYIFINSSLMNMQWSKNVKKTSKLFLNATEVNLNSTISKNILIWEFCLLVKGNKCYIENSDYKIPLLGLSQRLQI